MEDTYLNIIKVRLLPDGPWIDIPAIKGNGIRSIVFDESTKIITVTLDDGQSTTFDALADAYEDVQELIAEVRENVQELISSVEASETARETAEAGRVTAEAARGTAETARESAESARVSAEEQRAEEFAGWGATIAGKIDKSAQAEKTADMTQPVGIDADGKLFAKGGGTAEDITYDPDETYSDGTVGKELSTQSATIVDLGNALSALGLSVVNGKLCQTYEEE